MLVTGEPGLSQVPRAADPWWSHGTFYEIYPRSFADATGDGVGDLAGIRHHLADLQWLGVDAIWITPISPSPQVDFGYDVSDYCAIDPRFGTIADFDALQREADTRRIRIVLDLVLNHTSDQHEWFRQSAASRTNAKSGWYVWSNGLPADAPNLTTLQRQNLRDGRVPPNNWTSVFGGSAWTWAPARRQFYYHKFYAQQPDLNWRNPAVERAMFDVMRFWLDRGVAGFRLDAVPHLFEDERLRNEPEVGGTDPFGAPALDHIHTDNQPEVHGVLRRMRALVDGYPGVRVLIGETYLQNTAALDGWYGGAAHDELQLPMDTLIGFGPGAAYHPAFFRPLLAAAQRELHGNPPLLVFDNHDQPRSIDRFGDGAHDLAIAKGVATILLASRGAALTYYGAPIGMRTVPPERREDVRDPQGIAGWPREKGRDGERTPMQWNAGPQAGFTSSPRPWLPVNSDYRTVNVARERDDPASLLNWYRTLIGLRRNDPAFRAGDMVMAGDDPDILAWTRTDRASGRRVLVAINMGGRARTIAAGALAADLAGAKALRTLAAVSGAEARAATISLPAFSTWIGEIGAMPARDPRSGGPG